MLSAEWTDHHTKQFVPVRRDTLGIHLNLVVHRLQLTFVPLEFVEKTLAVNLDMTILGRSVQFAAACQDTLEMLW